MKKYDDIVCYDIGDENVEPEVTEHRIWFNGKGAPYETFFFDIGTRFSFCKTDKMPYVLPVCEVLLVLKAFMQDLKLSSF